jgi:hypothetical protein
MTDDRCWHPDLLRRFVPTPYVFDRYEGSNRFLVESNDLEIALSVRHSLVAHRQAKQTGGLTCKLIRDAAGSVDGSEITVISDGTLRVLYLGTGTILIHDHERSELLGFIARNVKAQELVSSLLPALFNA